MRDWAIRALPGLLWAGAFGLRCAYIFQSDASPFFDFPLVDAKTYADAAARLAVGQWDGGDEPFWQPPLYPYFLGLIFAFSEPGFYVPRLLQAAIGAGNCLLIYLLGRRVFSPAVGLAAGAAAAFYGPLIFFDAEFLPPTLAIFFDLLLLLTLLWAVRGGWQRLLVAGLIGGVSALCVANILLFLPFAAAWVYWQRADLPGRRRLLHLAPLFLGAALMIAPVTWRNGARGDWVLISSNAGINFFIGNNAKYEETVRIQPGPAWRALVSRPRLEAGLTRPSQKSLFFFEKAWEFALTEPAAYLRLLLYKTYLLGHGAEIGRNQDLYFARHYSSLLAALLWKSAIAFPFGLLAPLALLGVLLNRWRTPDRALLLLFLGVYGLSTVLFFVTARYRLPAIPILLLFAAYGAGRAWHLLRQRRWRPVAAPGAVALAALAVGNWNLSSMAMEADADTLHRLGFVFQQKGLHINAVDAYDRALALDPDIQEARFNLGSLYAQRGQYSQAEAEYREFVRRHPEQGEGRYALANIYSVTARYRRAAELYEELLESDLSVKKKDIGIRLAYAYLQLERLEEAAAVYRRLLAAQPELADVRLMLGQLCETRGLHEAAIQEYEELLRLAPRNDEARYRLAFALLLEERPEEAKTQLLEIIAQNSTSVEARWLLARQYVVEHRGGEALEQVEVILALEPDHAQANWVAGHLHVIRGDTLTGSDKLEVFKKLHVEGRQEEIRDLLLEQWSGQYGGAFGGER